MGDSFASAADAATAVSDPSSPTARPTPNPLAVVCRGWWDSLRPNYVVYYLREDAELRHVFFRCTLLSTVFLLSWRFFMYNVDSEMLSGVSRSAWGHVVGTVWVIPLYSVSQLLGLTWCSALYRLTVLAKARRRGEAPPALREVSVSQVSETLVKVCVTLVFALAAMMASMVPLVGGVLSYLMGSWLHAFYCFDYRLAATGVVEKGRLRPIPLKLVLQYFERRWLYFGAFGSTHMTIRIVLDSMGIPMIATTTLCLVLFAVNVIMAADATPTGRMSSLPLLTPILHWLSGIYLRYCGNQQAAQPT